MTSKLREPSRQGRAAAFTLIELLVVIAVIGILAAMLLPVMSSAKSKAKSAKCNNNVRQLMLAVTLYSAEGAEAFPLCNDPNTRSTWFLTISSFYKNKEGIMLCPDFKNEYAPEDGIMFWGNLCLPRPPTGPGRFGGVAYGINGYGIGKQSALPFGNVCLGIGPDGGLGMATVKTYSVVRPSEMLTVGDTMFFWGNAYTFNQTLGLNSLIPVPADRHKGFDNMAFADGHTASIKHSSIISNTDENRRRWNIDNEPHNEINIPPPPP